MKSESNLFTLLMRPNFDLHHSAKRPARPEPFRQLRPILKPPSFRNFPGKRTSTPGRLGHPTLRATHLRSLSSVV